MRRAARSKQERKYRAWRLIWNNKKQRQAEGEKMSGETIEEIKRERWKDEKQNVYRRDIPQETRQWKRAVTAPNSSIHFELQYLHYEKRVEGERERVG